MAALAGLAFGPRAALGQSASELKADSAAALSSLRRTNGVADKLAQSAVAILVFPKIFKAGFLLGGQVGEGVLYVRGEPAGFYNSVAASYGLQAGVQRFGYALMFLDDRSFASFESKLGFEVGVGPSVVVVDSGMAKTLTTSTMRDGIYAFIFNQSGLMAGMGIQGSKISRISN